MRGRPLVMLAAACALLAGCATPHQGAGAQDDPGLRDGPGGSSGSGGADPVELVNLWWVSDADGEAPDTWLRLDATSYQLWRDCDGFVEGGWTASGTVLVASAPYAVNGDCPSDPWPTVPWLEDARAYEPAGDGWRLLGADGTALATLTIDGAPDPIPTAAAFYTEPPEVTDDVRARLAEPAALPADLVPVTADALTGRWVPADGAPNRPFVELTADGTWSGSDGCNSSTGAWGVDVDGRILSTGGITTLIGCDGAQVPGLVSSASRAGFDGRVLVLLDREGTETGRLMRG